MAAPSPPGRPAALQLTLACDLVEVRAAAQVLKQFLAEQGCSETECVDCELALVEACNNAIQYAKPEPGQPPVLIEALCDPSEILLRITDHTDGFEWPAISTLPDAGSEHGRGLFLIRTVMDEAAYVHEGEGNVLVLRRKRVGKGA